MKNQDKKTKSDFTPAERRFGVLLENIDSKIDLVLEGHAALDHKIDRAAEDLDKKIEDFRAEVNVRFEEVNYKFDVVFDELHVIRNELKEKVGRDEFQLLEKRVTGLEKKISKVS